jgi:hypothetical protein
MYSVRRAGLAGLSAAALLLGALPAQAAASYDVSIADSSALEGDKVVFTVTVAGNHPAFTVDYATLPGLALDTTDYANTSGTLTIGANQVTAKIRVQSVQDNIFESDEDFSVQLSNTTANILNGGLAVGTIQNDDPVPLLSIGDVTVTEVDDPAASVDALFNVSLTNPASQDVTVHYATAPDTATGGNVDYRNANGTLTFPAGTNATQQVTVKVKGDLIHEGDERYFVNLSQAVNASLSDSQGVGTIHDDDPTPILSIPSAPLNVAEGDRQRIQNVTVSLSNPTVSDVTFKVSTSNGGAAAGSDYTDLGVNASGTIPAGSTSTQVGITILGDLRFEIGTENFFVIIDAPTNATLGNSVGEIVLLNDDPFIILGP